ncbi:putative phage integrase protein (plasmid) [Phaeobacter inhibens]|uniref:Phage integrase protein n=1 Tax=Phaeobacter inhibens TaxID=221822 RepID=A0ABM6RLG1_9RHOB|nr:site-specific integrase [Phaeobacter inhibens]AUQ93880.1 putative phage integrase protein [Phaeobacter inhibens]AUQ97377.1 putative phage integrase protein [Phaeobacter inhibens]
MGTIAERKLSDGRTAYKAQIIIKRKGEPTHRESRQFPRRSTAKAWMDRREKELRAPGGLEKARGKRKTLADAIDQYIDDHKKIYGRSKAQVLQKLKDMPISQKPCDEITSQHLVDLAREMGQDRATSTVGNYLSHLAPVFRMARPAWQIDLDPAAINDALIVCKRLGLISKSNRRDRRPTMDELDRLMSHYQDSAARGHMPMNKIIPFAIFSTRRQDEIVRIRWQDLDREHSRVLVKDMKNPGEKIGNDVWCELTLEAMQIIETMPQAETTDPIFPYRANNISASFIRTCALLGIEDLRFHDLRHEGVSRLFEMGKTIPQVASVSGHRSWQSLQRYSHIRATTDRFANWPWLDSITKPVEDQQQEA